ncbi:MAG: recombinase [Alcaligenaceae bacterium]|nr:recombinase [Alcaligenaceae bacterium]
MKGRTATLAQKHYHSLLADLGCIACRKDGIRNTPVSIHHIDGRTKPGAHWLVLPLCSGHHQDGTGAPGLIAIHPWKTRFEARYGAQRDLLKECIQLLIEQGHVLPGEALVAAGIELEAA